MIRGLTLALLLSAGAAQAAPDPGVPAARCAAFWMAMADFESKHANFAASPDNARALAEEFRAQAEAEGADVAAVLAEELPGYRLLMTAALIDDDALSLDIFRRRSETCDRIAKTR